MSLTITTTVTGSTVISARKLVEEKMGVSTDGVALIMVTDVSFEGVEASCVVVGEEVHITYAEGAVGTGQLSFEAVLV